MHLKKILLCLGALALVMVSCDKDFNELGANIVGGENYQLGTRQDWNVSASSVATGPLQSNNLPVNPLGIYTDPNFGKTTANYVTQLELAVAGPTIGNNPTVTDVVLKIPYFSTAKGEVDEDGNNLYELDSIYQKGNGKFKLEIYRSGYFLRNQEVSSGNQISTQYYFTDENAMIDAAKVPVLLNDAADTAENDAFFFDPAELVYTEQEEGEDEVITREAPAMEIHLNKAYFETALLETSAANLASNNAFKEYFRGLYFKTTQTNAADEALSMLDFSEGTITVTYDVDATTSEDADGRAERTMVLNLAGNSISLQNRENSFSVPPGRLALSGGPGFISQIDLLTPEQLQLMRDENWMINEASLTFTVDENAVPDDNNQARRIYLYSMDHKQPLFDYLYDNSTWPDVKKNKFVFGGILAKDDNGKRYYKVRVTNYLRSLLTSDSTNVRLGLSVTESIADATMIRRKSGGPDYDQGSDFVPRGSVMHPLSTILYGPDAAEEEKRLKLTVYYTKPE